MYIIRKKTKEKGKNKFKVKKKTLFEDESLSLCFVILEGEKKELAFFNS